MPTPSLKKEDCQEAFDALARAIREGYKMGGLPSARERAAQLMGMSSRSLKRRYERGLELGLKLDDPAPAPTLSEIDAGDSELHSKIRGLLTKQARTVSQLMNETGASIGRVLDVVDDLAEQGINVHRRDELFEIVKDANPSFKSREPLRYFSRPDNTYVFGASGDQHMGSKYSRYDVIDDLYDRFAAAEVDRVFNTGNWIDGDNRFNKFDLEVAGLEGQCQLMAERFPRREGIDTYAVWGDDHEGWYAQREGVDVGRYAESTMRAAGRTDWHDIGFMESHIELINSNSGRTALLAVVHPGGGSAYALSYSIQKIVESYEGGEKPEVGLYGHYHKLWSGLIRNVWVLQTGCTQDQTTFMRKKRLEAHVGGAIVKLEQDPESGAILSFAPQLIRYFNEDWYVRDGRGVNRWSHHGPVRQVPRSVGGIR